MVFHQRLGLLIILSLLLFKMTTAWAILIDRVAGVIDGEVITYSDVQIERIFKLSEGSERDVLERLIDRRLLLREAEKFNITETEEDSKEIQQRLQDIKRVISQDKFYNLLREYNLAESDILKRLKDRIIVEKFIDFRINFFIVISDEVIKAYYNAHKDEFGDRAVEDAYSQIKARLFQTESRGRLADYIDQLRRKAKISINLQD